MTPVVKTCGREFGWDVAVPKPEFADIGGCGGWLGLRQAERKPSSSIYREVTELESVADTYVRREGNTRALGG